MRGRECRGAYSITGGDNDFRGGQIIHCHCTSPTHRTASSFSSDSLLVFVFVSAVVVDAAFVVAQLGRTGGRRWSMIIPRRPSKIQFMDFSMLVMFWFKIWNAPSPEAVLFKVSCYFCTWIHMTIEYMTYEFICFETYAIFPVLDSLYFQHLVRHWRYGFKRHSKKVD